MVIVMKICTKCKIEKELGEYHKDSRAADGRKYSCKVCVKDYDSSPDIMARKRKTSYAYSKTEDGDKRRRAYRKTDAGRDSMAVAVAKERAANPEKHRARQLTYNAKRRGELVPEPCESCGETKVHAHHDDYSKPLDVRWLCKPCHSAWHRLHGDY